MSKLFKLTIFLIFSVCLLGFWNKPGVIETSVSKTKIQTGEVFTYQITVNGSFSAATLFLPEFNDFKILSRRKSKNYSINRGERNVSVNLIYQLFAPKAGVFTIEGAILEDNNRQFKGDSVTIEVKGRSLQEKKKILPYIEKGIDL